jgi:hypothetical protein
MLFAFKTHCRIASYERVLVVEAEDSECAEQLIRVAIGDWETPLNSVGSGKVACVSHGIHEVYCKVIA